MTQYLLVKNWEKFQHYKDRMPPWIKLHREVLDDYDMSCLQDASKLHLILIWVLASQLNNRVPNDPVWVAKKIGATSKVNLKELIDKGFLILQQSASIPLAECSPETEAYREEIDCLESSARVKISLDDLSIDHNAEWLAKKRSEGRYIEHDEQFVLEQFKQYCEAKGKKYANNLSGYRNAFEWDKCQPKQRVGGTGKSKWLSAAEQIIADDAATGRWAGRL